MALPADGGGDPFDGMTHAEMLKWLDSVDHTTMQHHADNLKKAATEIHKIAGHLKSRPQYVSWKGDGADAFRAWSSDVAKSTSKLGDFAQTSGKWLGEAAAAAGTAKSRMPKVPKADDNACYDTSKFGPGAQTPAQDKARQEAITEMRKVSSAYTQASGQMEMADRPVFPPMPKGFVPRGTEETSQTVYRSADSGQTGSASYAATGSSGSTSHQQGEFLQTTGTGHRVDHLTPLPQQPHDRTNLDSVDTLQKPPQQLPDNTSHPQAPNITGSTGPALPVTTPPPGGGLQRTPGIGRGGGIPTETPEESATGGRVPPRGVTGGVPKGVTGGVPKGGPTQKSPTLGRAMNTSRGIAGGRPQQKPVMGRGTGMQRGPVVGGKKSVQPGRGVPQGRVGSAGAQRSTSPSGRTTGVPRSPAQNGGRPVQEPLNETQRTANAGQSAAQPGQPPRGGVANSVPTRGASGPRALPPQHTGGVIGSNPNQPAPSERLSPGTPTQPRGGVAGAVPSHQPIQRMQSPGTSAVPEAGTAPRQAEQHQTNDSKQPYQPQPGINTEPNKKETPQTD